jgi:hypothetical protein
LAKRQDFRVRIPAVAMPAATAIVFMAIFEDITSNSFRYVPVIYKW